VEILVSVAILAGGTALILHALVRAAVACQAATHRTSAYTFAVSKMADLELSFRQGREPDRAGEFRAGTQDFAWQVAQAPLPGQEVEEGVPALHEVTLAVGWRQGAVAHATRVSTIVRALPAPQ
jgi:hypothetical protein